MKATWPIVGAVVAMVIVAAVIVSRGVPAETPRTVAPAPPTTSGRSPRIENPEAVASTPPEVARPTIDVELRHALSTSRNYREFIAKAKTEVERGGAAYAMYAMEICAGVRIAEREMKKQGPLPAAGDSKDIVARAEAKTLLDARCGPLLEGELDSITYRSTLKTGGDLGRDPLLRLETLPNRTADERRRIVAAILEAQDPLLWDRSTGMLIPVAWGRTPTAYFEGTVWDLDKEPALLMARGLVACGTGMSCDASDDTRVALVCMLAAICDHDRFELAKREAAGRGLPFDRVMMFYDRMVAAFKEKRVDAFVAP